MKKQYKGFEIEVTREKCMAGYPLLYYSVFRCSDGWELISGYEDSAETIPEMIASMKNIVDDFYENHQEYDKK